MILLNFVIFLFVEDKGEKCAKHSVRKAFKILGLYKNLKSFKNKQSYTWSPKKSWEFSDELDIVFVMD